MSVQVLGMLGLGKETLGLRHAWSTWHLRQASQAPAEEGIGWVDSARVHGSVSSLLGRHRHLHVGLALPLHAHHLASAANECLSRSFFFDGHWVTFGCPSSQHRILAVDLVLTSILRHRWPALSRITRTREEAHHAWRGILTILKMTMGHLLSTTMGQLVLEVVLLVAVELVEALWPRLAKHCLLLLHY